MALIRILESDDWFVDYDRERGMYRVSYFEDNHFVDECWFNAYEEKEISQEVIDKFCEIPLVNPIRTEDLKRILNK